MSVSLKLARHGQTKRPFYRIVATERLGRRDGRFIEVVGTYNTVTEPAQIMFKEEKIRKWIEVGAQPTETVRRLIIKNIPGLVEAKEKSKKDKLVAARKARKARAAIAAKK